MPTTETCQNDRVMVEATQSIAADPSARAGTTAASDRSVGVRRPLAASVLGVAALFLALPSGAQNRALQQRLANAGRIDCTFSTQIIGDWEGSDTTTEAVSSDLTAAFFDIDIDGGTAEAEGRFGASFIVVRQAYTYLHFMQMLRSGPLYLTTVLAEETTDGKLKAIHTRHEYSPTRLPGFTSRPEMYIGECAVEARPEDAL